MNLVDIIIIVLLATAALRGLRRGLLRSLAAIAGSIGGLFIGYRLAAPTTTWLETTFHVVTRLGDFFSRYIAAAVPVTANRPGDMTPAMLQQVLAAPSIPGPVRTYFEANLTQTLSRVHQAGSLANLLAQTMGRLLITALAFWVIFAFCHELARWAGQWLTDVAEQSPLDFPNHLGGAVVGLIEGAIGLVLTVGILSLALPLFPPDGAIVTTFANSTLVKLCLNAFNTLVPASVFASVAGLRH